MADTKTKETKLKETKSKETKTKTKETQITKETKPKAKEIKVKDAQTEESNEVEEEILPVKAEGNFVYIGKKGAMAYVLAVTTQFEMGATKVIVKARGKSISRAVDVAEIVRNRGIGIKVERIGIATEEVVTQEGRPLKISSIEIILTK